MTSVIRALDRFFSGFGIPAYPEGNAPTEPGPPYITVQIVSPRWDAPVAFYARVWYRAAYLTEISAKVDEIAAAIGEGVSIPTETGVVWIHKGDNFAQRQEMAGDPTLQCVYLSMILQAFTD